MNHLTIKRILITRVIELISSKYKLSIDDARDKVYASPIVDLLDDDETGLYGDSPLYILSIYENL